MKTHRGIQVEFLRLTRNDPRIAAEMRSFLSRAYNLKAIADYETGPDNEVSPERAMAAVEEGRRFVELLATLVAA